MTSTNKAKFDEKDIQRALQWDEFAARFAPMQVDAAWFAELKMDQKDKEKQERMATLRFYLKVVYWVAVHAFNYSQIKWTFVQFEMPETHLDDWCRISESKREMLFRELRFCHVSGVDTEAPCVPTFVNSFAMMCDQLSLSMIGHLDNLFVARHGIQLPLGSIKCREATREESLVYLETRIRIDKTLLDKARSDDDDDDNNEIRLESLKHMIASAVKMKRELQAASAEKEKTEKK